MLVHRAAAAFVDHCRNERGLSAHSIAAYHQDLAEFARLFGAKKVGEITGDDLTFYVSYLSATRRLAPATVRRRLACLKSMFAWFVRRKKLQSNPFASIELRVRIPTRLPRALMRTDMLKLACTADEAPRPIRLATLLLFTTGVRVSELTAVRLRDIDLQEGVIRIFGKGSRERQVFVTNPGLLTELRRFVHEDRVGAPATASLFVNRSGRPLSSALLRARLKTLARQAGLTRKVTPHVLRHTAATALLEAGTDIRFVQRLLGHQSIATTQIYVHVADVALKAAISSADTVGRLARVA